jgi:hypothetical protein
MMQLVSTSIPDSRIDIEGWAAQQGYIVTNVREVPDVRVFLCDVVAYDPDYQESDTSC